MIDIVFAVSEGFPYHDDISFGGYSLLYTRKHNRQAIWSLRPQL
jgi:hypothetical protein